MCFEERREKEDKKGKIGEVGRRLYTSAEERGRTNRTRQQKERKNGSLPREERQKSYLLSSRREASKKRLKERLTGTPIGRKGRTFFLYFPPAPHSSQIYSVSLSLFCSWFLPAWTLFARVRGGKRKRRNNLWGMAMSYFFSYALDVPLSSSLFSCTYTSIYSPLPGGVGLLLVPWQEINCFFLVSVSKDCR